MLWSIGLALVALGVCLPLFLYYKKALHLHLACAYKCLGTMCAVLPALISAVRLEPRCWICTAALFIYCVADYVLEFNFMFGAGLFLCGHICAVSYYLGLCSVSAVHLVAILMLGASSAFIFWKWKQPIGKQMAFFVIYGLSLILMCSCSLGCFGLFNMMGILIACGGSLFFISDILVLRRTLFPSDKLIDWAVMITYYGAILLFGISCLLG